MELLGVNGWQQVWGLVEDADSTFSEELSVNHDFIVYSLDMSSPRWTSYFPIGGGEQTWFDFQPEEPTNK